MLVLTRNIGESIVIGDDIVITYLKDTVRPGQIHIGIEAPNNVKILREELMGITDTK